MQDPSADPIPAAPIFLRLNDETEEAESSALPAFDMVAVLSNDEPAAQPEGGEDVEVIRYRGLHVLDVSRVDRAEPHRFAGTSRVEYLADVGPAVFVAAGTTAALRRNGSWSRIEGRSVLLWGDVVTLTVNDVGYIIQKTEARKSAREQLIALPEPATRAATFGALAFHLALAILLVVTHALTPPTENWSGFARVQIPEKPVATPAPTPAAKPTPTPRKLARVEPNRKKAPLTSQRTKHKQAASSGVLGGLGKIDLKIESSSPMLAAVTNFDAVRSTSGKSGGFKVSALTGRVPGEPTAGRVGRANGTVDISTLGSKDLAGLAKGGFGGISKAKGKVRGVVSAAPPATVGVQGSLARAQIAEVVNKHISEIRRCYERGLLDDASLAGKVQMEWTIDPQGRVQRVRTKFNSMQGGDVSSCMASRIRTWVFPKPKGNGSVIVNYPFMFDSVGF